MIYLDNAATSLRRPEGVVRAVSEALCSMGNVGRGASESALSAARVVYAAREKLCAFFGGADPSRVCFTQNSTEALNTAIFGLLRPGDHVISTDLEHNSVLRPLYRLEQEGVEVTFLRADARGCIDYADLPRALRPNTRAIVCTHASNLTGNALDASRIGAFAREHGLLFILDASQTAGSFDLNAQRRRFCPLLHRAQGHDGAAGDRRAHRRARRGDPPAQDRRHGRAVLPARAAGGISDAARERHAQRPRHRGGCPRRWIS